MNESEMMHLKRAVTSLASSTHVVLRAHGVQAEVWGRCSPYSSHRLVKYGEALATRDNVLAITAANGKYALVVCKRESDAIIEPWPLSDDGMEREFVKAKVPTALLQPLLDEVNRWLGPVELPPVVTVVTSRHVLAGFDEEGRPIWRQAETGKAEPEFEISEPDGAEDSGL
jgi:hypothetical protein